ncbi:adenylosuccinate synthetase [Mesorhizobium sp. WSM2561]|uniref:adenylosuccinate synthetase n=1 Tax=Mesorhizobium sp. WSM2561 TaxID=1040985 RepID=UPI0004B6FBC2|nr:adenylosuccinate synthetase [Mesorhizobium sp. WSM2561]
MPISIVVGGQFGSEGKGKVALEIVRRSREPVTVVRVGGPNSGHTAYDRNGRRWALRQLPAACIDLNVDVFFPAGSYIDIELLFHEADALDFPRERIFINEYANIITGDHKAWEASAGLVGTLGSTGSGVGAAVMASVAREALNFPVRAVHAKDLSYSIRLFDTTAILQQRVLRGDRIVIEGSQGFGLSLLDGWYWPKATARSTTAAAALAEAGLSPRYVDDICMVLRTFPIRVAGDSGPLAGETTWEQIAKDAGRSDDIREYTTVTRNLRRVGTFDEKLVRRAISANAPHRIVLNHLDYVSKDHAAGAGRQKVIDFIQDIEKRIGAKVDLVGFSGSTLLHREEVVA